MGPPTSEVGDISPPSSGCAMRHFNIRAGLTSDRPVPVLPGPRNTRHLGTAKDRRERASAAAGAGSRYELEGVGPSGKTSLLTKACGHRGAGSTSQESDRLVLSSPGRAASQFTELAGKSFAAHKHNVMCRGQLPPKLLAGF